MVQTETYMSNEPDTSEKPEEAPVVRRGEVVATFFLEMKEMIDELGARRRFDNVFGDYLREKGLLEEFNEWRAKKN